MQVVTTGRPQNPVQERNFEGLLAEKSQLLKQVEELQLELKKKDAEVVKLYRALERDEVGGQQMGGGLNAGWLAD